ncbi:MAG: hypothetical protein H7331_10035 [Bacteroidia bacterium]|nr:hypothetical protein [Bacteroidia bacterium]
MNKRIKTSVVLLFLFLQMQAFAQNKKENFVGKWKAPKGDIIIISVLGKSFVGKTAKQNIVVLKDVKFSENKWQGVVLNPREHITAKCELILYPNKLKIIARKGVFTKTLYWKKVV